MAKVIKTRSFGGTPAVDFLDLSYLMPVMAAAAINEKADYPFRFGSPLKTAAAVFQSSGRLPRWKLYEIFVRTLMATGPEAESVRSHNFARWVTSLYGNKKHPYVVMGPPLGSLVYLAMVLDAPFLPLNYRLAVRHKPINPDNVREHIEQAKKLAAYFNKNDQNIHLVHEFDPVHQRFRLKHGSLLRCRFVTMPEAYRDFIKNNLTHDGTVMMVESRIGWRQYRIAENLSHQVGQPGGIPCEEYLFGSPRMDKFRAKFMQTEADYRLGMADEVQPESRFGVAPRMRLSVIETANEYNRNICQLFTEEIYLVNQLVSQLFVRCSRREGIRPRFCFVHSGNFIAPHACMQSGLLPVWAPTPCYPAYEFVQEYLKRYRFDLEEILVAFEPSVEEAPDFLGIERWREMLSERARVRLIGMNPRMFPREITSMFRFWPEIMRWSKRHKQPMLLRVTTDTVVQEAEKCSIHFQVTENT